MANYSSKITIIFVASTALCLMSFLGSAYGDSHFTVEGARVRLACRDLEDGSLTFSEEAETDETGTYRIEVDGDHEDEICEVIPVKSSDPDCSRISQGELLRKAYRVSLTSNNLVVSGVCRVNPVGFWKKESLPGCIDVLRELGFTETGELVHEKLFLVYPKQNSLLVFGIVFCKTRTRSPCQEGLC